MSSSSPATRSLRVTHSHDIVLGNEPEYLIQGLLPAQGLAVVYGNAKTGKSFLALDWSYHIAAGENFRGLDVLQGPVVYCAYEGEAGVRKRWVAIRKHYGWEKKLPFFLVEFAAPLKGNAARNIIIEVQAELERQGFRDVGPRIIVIDTLARSIDGSDREDMGAYIQELKKFEGWECLVMVIHHKGKVSDTPRGGSELMGAADVQILVEKQDKTAFSYEVEFLKDGPEGAIVLNELKVIDLGPDDKGHPRTTCVVMALEEVSMQERKAETLKDYNITQDVRMRVALSRLGPHRIGVNVPFKEFHEYCCRVGVISEGKSYESREKAFDRAIKKNLKEGFITDNGDGTITLTGREVPNEEIDRDVSSV